MNPPHADSPPCCVVCCVVSCCVVSCCVVAWRGVHRAFLRAARLEPFNSQVFTWLGHYFRHVASNPARAAQCYAKAFACDPGNTAAGVAVVDGHLANGQHLLAATACRDAVAAEPRARWAWWRLGELLLRSSSPADAAGAVAAFQSALRLASKEAGCWDGLARAYLGQGKLTASLKASARALELSPWAIPYVATHALVNSRLQEHETAVALWRRVVAARPNDAAARHYLAASHLAIARASCLGGTFGQAARSLVAGVRQAVTVTKLQPSVASAWKLLGDLHTQAYYVYPPLFGAAAGGDAGASSHGDGPRAVVAKPLAGFAQAGAAAYARAIALLATPGAPSGSAPPGAAPTPTAAAGYPTEHRASAWCDLGTNLYFQAVAARQRAGGGSGLVALRAARAAGASLAEAAAKVFRFAAHLCPAHFKAWLGLGVCELRPLFAQHALVRAVQLGSGASGETAVAWTNLGMLCVAPLPCPRL